MDLVSKDPYKLYINGEYVPSVSGKTQDCVNPATNEVFAKAYYGDVADAELAVKAARKAFDEGPWGKMAARDRSKILLKAAQIMERRAEEFATLEALECGYHYGSARYYCVPMAVDAFNFFAGKARDLEGKVVPSDYGTLNYVTWNPVGVVAEILPWNGPYLMGCQKINAILAAGNTCVIKPPSWGVLSLLQLAGVYEEAGLPAGVFNVVTGSGGAVGAYLTKHPDVDMVAMTGGTSTGREVIRNSAERIKDIALELGGKSPNIFFEDVDVKTAAKWAVWGFTNHSGQICVSGTRVLVHRSIYEEFIEEMKKEGWDRGKDDEELFEFAMHERQYRDYKSGVAKERFEKELEAAKEKAGAPKIITRPVVEVPAFDAAKVMELHPNAMPVQAVAKGKLIWQYNVTDDSTALAIGTPVEEGKPMCYIQTYYGVEPVMAPKTGKVIQIEAAHNADVVINQVLAFIE